MGEKGDCSFEKAVVRCSDDGNSGGGAISSAIWAYDGQIAAGTGNRDLAPSRSLPWLPAIGQIIRT